MDGLPTFIRRGGTLKRRKQFLILGTLALLTGVQSTNAQEHDAVDGNTILEWCAPVVNDENPEAMNKNPEDNTAWCLGFAYGVLAGGARIAALKGNDCALFCPPGGKLTSAQILRVIVAALKAHPEALHLDPDLLAMRALRQAFPCSKSAEP